MPEVKLYPSTLVSSDADLPKLANTDNLYDRPRKAFQDTLNSNLASSDEALSGRIDALLRRVMALESKSGDMHHCDEDGFFIVDDQLRIGACVLPEDVRYGWDGEAAATSPELTTNNGGVYVIIPGANFSTMNIGTLGSATHVDIEEIFLSSPEWVSSDAPNERQITATPDTNHSSYNGGYIWTVTGGSEYFVLDPAVQHGSTATFKVLSGASTSSAVEVTCQAKNNPQVFKTITFNVTYVKPATTITNVNIYYTESANSSNSSSSPIEGQSFGLRAVAFSGDTAVDPSAVATYTWTITSGDKVSIITGADKQVAYFGISADAISASSCTIKCEVQDKTSSPSAVYNTVTVWVQYESIYASADWHGITIDDYDHIQTSEQQTLSVKSVPVAEDIESVDWSIEQGRATINAQGVLALSDDSVVGETIVARAAVANPDYDSSDPDSEEFFTADAIVTSNYSVPLKQIKIVGGNRYVEGQNIQMSVEATPNTTNNNTAVRWSITSATSRYVGIDKQGLITVSSLLGSDTAYVVVKAQSIIDHTISDEVHLAIKYMPDANGATDFAHLGASVSVGGDSATFYWRAWKTEKGDGVWLNPNDVTVQIESLQNIMTEGDVQDGINTATSSAPASQAPISIMAPSAMMVLPINGTEESTLLNQNENYYSRTEFDQVINQFTLQFTNNTNNQTNTPGISSETVAPLRGARSVTVLPTFTDNVLDFSNIEDGETFGVHILAEYTYTDSNGNARTLKVGGYYEFTRHAGKLPVTGIVLTNHTFNGCYPCYKNIKNSVQPICAPGKSVSDYLFDPSKITIEHINGSKASDYSEVSGYLYTVRSGAGAGSQEQWDICYRLQGEGNFWLQRDNKWNTGNYSQSNSAFWWPIRPKIVIRDTVTLVYDNSVVNTSSIHITPSTEDEAAFTVNAPNSVPDGGQLSALNQNNYPVNAYWSVTEGSNYCSVNGQGVIRIFDTGGTAQSVTVEAEYQGHTDRTTFTVQSGVDQ